MRSSTTVSRWILLAVPLHGPTTRANSTVDATLQTDIQSMRFPLMLPSGHGEWCRMAQNETTWRDPPDSARTGPQDCLGPYCLYANPGFANGRGMVIITTAENLPLLKAAYDNQDPSGTSSPPVEVKDIPGKGLGLVATQTLKRGHALMLQSPVFVADLAFARQRPASRVNAMLDTAIALLPAPTQELFLAQMGRFGGHSVRDIIKTNAFHFLRGDEHFSGVYLDVSRFNHACRPNVAYYVDANLAMHATVARTVQPGEELTISYFDVFKPQVERRRHAHQGWGFTCRCAQCSLPEHVATESDARLRRMKELERELEDPAAWTTMDSVNLMIRLHLQEDMDVRMAGILTVAALNANLLGLEDEARRYAHLAAEAGEIEGDETGSVESMRQMARDPGGYFTWREVFRE